MIEESLSELITDELPHAPTPCQEEAIAALAHFLVTPAPCPASVLRGYAGTGKTTLIGALVRVMQKLQRSIVLMAPTGRAAKVLTLHAGRPASTIHRTIYRQQTFAGEGTRFSLGFNKLHNALFIVDEASMIASDTAGSGLFGSGMLLDDLLHFVYEGPGCQLLFVGDLAQLPPVGEEESPALQVAKLQEYGLTVSVANLTDVVRQSSRSGILANATNVRNALRRGDGQLPVIVGAEHGDVRFISGNDLIEALVTAYDECGTDGTIVVTRSNKTANIYNAGIRSMVFYREEELTRGDMVMAVKNNYFWTAQALRETQDAHLPPPAMTFVANGDIAEVVTVRNVHQMYGFTFADATLAFPDYDGEELSCRVLLSTLRSEAPALTAQEQQRLYESVLADYADVPSKKERMKRVREDAYYNAIQLKYAYAVTCHKAQGGQWERVFIDQGYIPPESIGDQSYLRWLYTAITRSTARLYFVNWPAQMREVLEEGEEEEE